MTAQDTKDETSQTAADPATEEQVPEDASVEPEGEAQESASTEVDAESSEAGEAAAEETATPSADDEASDDVGADAAAAQPVEFQPLEPVSAPQAGENLDLLLDVTVALSVELGGAEMPLSEILSLGPNSVVKLDRAVGEPVDILINRELVGRGEVVVVEDYLGVRVTELLKQPGGSKPRS